MLRFSSVRLSAVLAGVAFCAASGDRPLATLGDESARTESGAAATEAVGDSTVSAPAGSGVPASNPEGAGETKAGSAGWFGTDRPLIVPSFVDAFPGVDLKGLTPPERERFLHRANTEPCTCGQDGCVRHTLGFCLKVDPGCPRARASLRKIAAEIVAARPKAAPTGGASRPAAR